MSVYVEMTIIVWHARRWCRPCVRARLRALAIESPVGTRRCVGIDACTERCGCTASAFTRPVHPHQTCLPSSDLSALIRPICPHQNRLPSSDLSALIRSVCPDQTCLPSSDLSALIRSACPHQTCLPSSDLPALTRPVRPHEICLPVLVGARVRPRHFKRRCRTCPGLRPRVGKRQHKLSGMHALPCRLSHAGDKAQCRLHHAGSAMQGRFTSRRARPKDTQKYNRKCAYSVSNGLLARTSNDTHFFHSLACLPLIAGLRAWGIWAGALTTTA
eukprot:359666-Chlamydomonas_euryale.AAC.2